ncbi:polysaccharide biosynthesis/export family protein [Prevotella intermedia]|jgi:polysaccharide biosynthesis/export protein|uniref:Putative polysaccharide export protein n=1 Tax=Prevotella intermedia TaxID=28131 RepID=A0A0S3UI79_PREIN|nr:polysaccharide biosynthesis/export family protein [Prevotella intermedia]ATV38736.1 sugar transporter [Prevotella intermedia]AWX07675.1 polysaccharide export protein [Prevotella intermedia]PIK18569.1 sugar transporter [Prevotella intermedia]BAU17202.1 putative polysaccharide export protein [Prevotella intermedia]
MKKLLLPIMVVTMILMMVGCGSSKEVAYWQNIDSISLAASKGLYDAKIMPKDELTILVQTTDPLTSEPFNLRSTGQTSSKNQITGYLVDNDGMINLPIVGKIHVAGLTKTECEDLIKSKIQPYLARTENPLVSVRTSSYRITVIGEVNRPGVIPVATEKISLIEALAEAGDMTIYGKRDNVLLVREDKSGEKHKVRLNMNDANIINSPYYYLQQNDIVYVEPHKVKARNTFFGSNTSIFYSVIGITTSLVSLLITILR